MALHEADSQSGQAEAEAWVAATALRVQALAAASAAAASNGPGADNREPAEAVRGAPEQQPRTLKQQAAQAAQAAQVAQAAVAGAFRQREGRRRYLRNVASCKRALHDGESYEICLTTMLSRRGSRSSSSSNGGAAVLPDAAQLYRTLRRINPAPYAGELAAALPFLLLQHGLHILRECHVSKCLLISPHPANPTAAWLRFGEGDLQLCCCSPERFLRGDRGGQLEAKPIKGTAPRCSDPREDALAAAALAGALAGRQPAPSPTQHSCCPSAPLPSQHTIYVCCPALPSTRPEPCRCRCSLREGPRRKPDDRRPASQRPRAGLCARQRARPRADADRELRHG